MCAEHAGMYIGFRYGTKPHAVMLLPSVTHWLNYDYMLLMLNAVLFIDYPYFIELCSVKELVMPIKLTVLTVW